MEKMSQTGCAHILETQNQTKFTIKNPLADSWGGGLVLKHLQKFSLPAADMCKMFCF